MDLEKIEAIVGTLIFTVLAIFTFEVYISSPNVLNLLNGFVPYTEIITNKGILYIALGIVGATIMPHNLYLHSSIVQSRKYDRNNNEDKAQAIKYATIDLQHPIIYCICSQLLVINIGRSTIFRN